MAPILVDKQDLIKLGFISVLTIVLAFAGGFMFGQQQATMGHLYDVTYRDQKVDHSDESLQQPGQSARLDDNIENQSPETVHVDDTIVITQAEPVGKPKPSSVTESVVVAKAKNNTDAVVKDKVIKDKAIKDKAIKDRAAKEKAAAISSVPAAVPDENKEIRYSIQVAVYGRLNNAENMMKLLQAEEMDAYVSDYINKKNKVRFNVRFGYFTDKKTALAALDDYIKVQKGDGYLVNYSAKNIVDIAKAEAENKAPDIEELVIEELVIEKQIKKPVDRSVMTKQSADAEQTDNNHTKAVPPMDAASDNVSLVEGEKTSDEIEKVQAQSKNLVY